MTIRPDFVGFILPLTNPQSKVVASRETRQSGKEAVSPKPPLPPSPSPRWFHILEHLVATGWGQWAGALAPGLRGIGENGNRIDHLVLSSQSMVQVCEILIFSGLQESGQCLVGGTKGPNQLSRAPRNSNGCPSTSFEYYHHLCVS